MYLLVFVTLIISLIGIYAQVVSLQTARMFSNQNGIARAMIQWQSAAISMASSIIKTRPLSDYSTQANNLGCYISDDTFTVMPKCNPPIGTPNASGTVTNVAALNFVLNSAAGKVECVHLPATCTTMDGANNCTACAPLYNTTNYRFYSILYQTATNQNYVVTFVRPPAISAANPAPGFITLSSGTQVGITASDLLKQLRNAKMPSYTYGTVNANQLQAGGFTYNFPAGAIENGSVAIVWSPDGL